MTISDIVAQREIAQVMHFTTNNGLIGIIDSALLKARAQLAQDQRLEFILKNNTEFRRDTDWVDHVSLSLSRINGTFFDFCSKWHDDIFWCVLCLDPIILQHENVYFTTTNNIYPSVVRAMGPEGLDAMFANQVSSRYGSTVTRSADMPDNFTTDVQAEVLYPTAIPIAHMVRILVDEQEKADEICGITHAFGYPDILVEVEEGLFG